MKHNIDDIFDIDFDFQFDFNFDWNTDDLQRENSEKNVKTLQMLHYKKEYSF